MILESRFLPKNLSAEPDYANDDTVLFFLSDPEVTGHLASKECQIEELHKTEDCGLWKDNDKS